MRWEDKEARARMKGCCHAEVCTADGVAKQEFWAVIGIRQHDQAQLWWLGGGEEGREEVFRLKKKSAKKELVVRLRAQPALRWCVFFALDLDSPWLAP